MLLWTRSTTWYVVFVWRDGIGKEVISRFVTDLNNDKVFYTDANGREMLQRMYVYDRNSYL